MNQFLFVEQQSTPARIMEIAKWHSEFHVEFLEELHQFKTWFSDTDKLTQ